MKFIREYVNGMTCYDILIFLVLFWATVTVVCISIVRIGSALYNGG